MKMRLALEWVRTCSWISSNRPSGSRTGRRSKKTLESIRAMGSGRSIQVVKYFVQIRSGWRHLGFVAMTSPGQ